MKPFMDENFLLQTETARRLYHQHAKTQPIIDYHCHLNPAMIADNHRFQTITELWLGGDHYKWRAMRANGIDERYITGNATDEEKFMKWAETVPYTLRNPLYHWTHLELRTAFDITELLNPTTAAHIYETCNELLQQPEFHARGLMKHYNVECVCTTDDPTDTLEHHRKIRSDKFETKVLPTWRPDKAMAVSDPVAYRAYIEHLSSISNISINSLQKLYEALRKRQDFFADNGCSLADHGVCRFPWAECSETQAARLFDKVMSGQMLSGQETEELQTAILLELARMNHEKGWVQQFHFGPMRNTNTRMFRTIGPDTGFDTIGDYRSAEAIARFLDALDAENRLTKTILYNLNPADNSVTAALTANFQDGTIPGKIQFGSGWWFNDQIEGMTAQMNALSLQGLLSRFVGMLTDSRSFLSYPRHEYFRRVLCNLIGNDVESGLIPEGEMERVCGMVEDICYRNAKNYFCF